MALLRAELNADASTSTQSLLIACDRHVVDADLRGLATVGFQLFQQELRTLRPRGDLQWP